jgi:pimeloyl-ACP methyl ester carboxylesterase
MNRREIAVHAADLRSAHIEYLEAGEGKPVVFFHEAGGVAANAAFIPALATRYRVLLPSRPGFDGSTGEPAILADVAEIMAEFISKVAGEPVQLLAESAGGAPACWLATVHPELVDKLILAAPAAFHVHSGEPQGPPPTPEEIDLRLFGPNPCWQTPPTAEDNERRRKNSAYNMRRWRSPDGNNDLRERLHEIKAPTLILWGTDDQVIPQEQGAIYQREIPQAYLMYIYKAAHALSVSAGKQFVALATDFIERGPAFVVNQPVEAPL